MSLLDRLRANLAGEFQDKLTWAFNPRTEQDYYDHFKSKYLVTDPGSVKKKING